MTKAEFRIIEDFMLSCMKDMAHDKDHVYRVLYTALDIAKCENGVDYDVLIAACLLHDVGRKEQFENPELCHAQAGAEKSYAFLLGLGYSKEFAEKVKVAIKAHRFRSDDEPESLEAKILFDADKIDVTGAIGIARTLVYRGEVFEPLYTLDENGKVSEGIDDERPSFFHEYNFKLKNLYSRFYTKRGRELAESRRDAAVSFYESLLREVREPYEKGQRNLKNLIEQ